jgi:lysophospholipase L1-like esterase
VLIDCLPRSDAAAGVNFATRRATFNADFAANAASHADAIIRLSTNTDIGDDGDSDVTTYYDGDKVHLNAAGHAIVASAVVSALVSLGVT